MGAPLMHSPVGGGGRPGQDVMELVKTEYRATVKSTRQSSKDPKIESAHSLVRAGGRPVAVRVQASKKNKNVQSDE